MLGDRTKYIEHIVDKEQLMVMRKILDKAELVLKYHELEYTDFLDPYQRELAYSILNRIDVAYHSEGGILEAERKSIVIFPDYMTIETIDNPIRAILITGNFKFNSLSHRDYLGAILGLGVKREKVGDILISEDSAYVVVHKDLADFFVYNLKTIGKESVSVEEVSLADIVIPEEEFDDLSLIVSSLRLDSVISGACNMSRSKSAVLIGQGKVKVNFRVIENVSLELKEGDVLSVRKFGRMKLVEMTGKSKKGKEKIKVRVYK